MGGTRSLAGQSRGSAVWRKALAALTKTAPKLTRRAANVAYFRQGAIRQQGNGGHLLTMKGIVRAIRIKASDGTINYQKYGNLLEW